MPKKNPTSVALDAAVVNEALAWLFVLDLKIEAFKGTIAEKLKEADAHAAAAPLDKEHNAAIVAGLIESSTLGDFQDELDFLVEAVKQQRAEHRTAFLKSSGGDEQLKAMLEQRAAIVTGVETVSTVLVQFGVLDAAPTIPAAPKVSITGKASNGGGKRAPKVSGAAYWWDIGDGKRYQGATQNSVSSIAFYRGRDLLGIPVEGKKHSVPAEQLRQAIVNAGGNPDASTAWSIKLPGGSMGMDVVDSPAAD